MPLCTQCETRPGHIYDSEGTELICKTCAGVNSGEAVADLARGLDFDAIPSKPKRLSMWDCIRDGAK